jgi:hypothetical protein
MKGELRYSSLLDLGSARMCVVSFILCPLYSRGKFPDAHRI